MDFLIAVVGCWAVWFSYNMSLTRGRHRRKKRGIWDYAWGKDKRDWMELAELVHADRAGYEWGVG